MDPERKADLAINVSQFEHNLEELKAAVDQLSKSKDELLQKVQDQDRDQEGPGDAVQKWLDSAQDKLEEAAQLIRDGENEIAEEKHTLDKRIADLKKQVDILNQNRRPFEPDQGTRAALPQPVVEIECANIGQTGGLQEKLEEAWRVLMKPEVGILGIYGVEGAGKTTLLAHIHNKFLRTLNDFDFIVWIVVSKEFTLTRVQEEIGERIGIAETVNGWKGKGIGEKSSEIRNFLQKKKFALLLDDLREKVHLKKIGIPIPNCQNGSKIVLTTPSELICSLMDVNKRIKVDTLPPGCGTH